MRGASLMSRSEVTSRRSVSRNVYQVDEHYVTKVTELTRPSTTWKPTFCRFTAARCGTRSLHAVEFLCIGFGYRHGRFLNFK